MKNKLGIYYAFWEREWAADFFRYVEKAARIGFDVLEINAGAVAAMASKERKALAAAARDAGVDLTYCIGMPPAYDVSSEDPAVRRSGIEYAKRILDGMGEMGGRTIGGILYGAWPAQMARPMEDKSRIWDLSAASVREIARAAQDLGITYCLEIVNRFEQFLLNTAQEGMRFVDEVGSPNVKLLLDAFHMNIEEDFIGRAIEGAAGYIGHFHVGESNRRVPGRGHMPWDEILDALNAARYQGAIVMEPFLRMGGQVGLDIRVWRDLSGGGDDDFLDAEAAFALQFLRAKLSEREAAV